jgi:hypothetical protein
MIITLDEFSLVDGKSKTKSKLAAELNTSRSTIAIWLKCPNDVLIRINGDEITAHPAHDYGKLSR